MAGSGVAVFFTATRDVGFFGGSAGGGSVLTAGLVFAAPETDAPAAATLFDAARFATADFFAAAGFGALAESAGTTPAFFRATGAARFLAGLTAVLVSLSLDGAGVVAVLLAAASIGGIDSAKSPVGASVITSSRVRPGRRGGWLEEGMDAV